MGGIGFDGGGRAGDGTRFDGREGVGGAGAGVRDGEP